jgi:hypothetical protein
MSTSGGPTSTTTQGISPQLAPYLDQFGQMASTYANTPYQQYQGTQVAPLSGLQNQALGGFSSLMGQAAPGMSAASSYLTNLLSSNPANDPNVANMMAASNRQTTNAYNDATQGITQRYNTTGNFGGIRNQIAQDRSNTDLATGLAQGNAGIMDQALQAGLNRQANAVSGVGSLLGSATSALGGAMNAGSVPQQYGQNLATAQQTNFQNQFNYPSQVLGNLSSYVGSMMGAAPHTTTTQGPAPDPMSQGLGLALLGSRMGSSGTSKTGG